MLLASLALSLLLAHNSPAAPAATPLFNGHDLTGWVNVNCAPSTWTVGKDVDGTPTIVCSGHPTGVLRTATMYENFVCEFDFSHREPKTNAGFFVWSDAITARGQPFTRSIEVQVMDGIEATKEINGKTEIIYTSHGDIFSIHGSTMKPDRPHPDGWQRCLPSERRAKPAPEWNHYKVTGNNGTLKLEVNGKEVSGGVDISPRKGYLCLESEGGEVWFKNLVITELPAASPALPASMVATADEGFRSIFNGHDLTGWKADGETAKHWTVNDWVLSYDGKGSDLWSNESFDDFEMIVDWRWTGNDQGKLRRPRFNPDGSDKRDAKGEVEMVEIGERDSGIFLRGNSKSQVNIWCWPCGSGEVWGYRTDPTSSPETKRACTPKKAMDRPVGDWNRFRIRMEGETLNVWLNGEQVIENAVLKGVPKSGPVALQTHGSSIDFGNIYVRPLH
jgi:hypothetical protein